MMLIMEVSLLNRTISYVIYGVIALGILGLFSELVKNPFGLLMNIAIIAAIAGIVYLVYTRLTQGKTDRKEPNLLLEKQFATLRNEARTVPQKKPMLRI